MSWLTPENIFESDLKKVIEFKQQELKKYQFRSSYLPFCPMEFILAKLFPEKYLHDNGFSYKFFTRIGTEVHSLLQEGFAKTGRLFGNWKCHRCGSEFKNIAEYLCPNCKELMEYKELEMVEPTTGFSAHSDGIWLYKDRKYVLEFKTINTDGLFTKVQSTGNPIWYHYLQASSYVYLLRNLPEFNFKDLDTIIFVYITRDNPFKHASIFKPAMPDSVFEYTLSLFKKTKDNLINGNFDNIPKACNKVKNCPFTDFCNSPDLIDKIKERWNIKKDEF